MYSAATFRPDQLETCLRWRLPIGRGEPRRPRSNPRSRPEGAPCPATRRPGARARRLPFLAALIALLALTPALLALSPGVASAAYPDNVAQPVNFGDAGFFGPAGGLTLNAPDVGMASTHDGQGYWIVASDGGIFNYGDAGFFGSAGSIHLNQPIVGMAPTPGRRRLLARGFGRRHLQLRRCRLLRVTRRTTTQLTHRGHGGHGRRPGLLAGGRGRRHLQLWGRWLLRVGWSHSPEQARGRHGARSRRNRLLVGGVRWRHLLLRQRALPGLHRWDAFGLAHRRHGCFGWRLPARGGGRRRLQLRHGLLRLHGRCSAHQPDSRHCGDTERRRVLAPAVADAASSAHRAARFDGRCGRTAADPALLVGVLGRHDER